MVAPARLPGPLGAKWRVRQQFEAAIALPSPSARATVSALQVPAAKCAPNLLGGSARPGSSPQRQRSLSSCLGIYTSTC
ncbi:TPA: hypothetical protein ACH3X1_008545 [Trebouxia sp. C0004]